MYLRASGSISCNKCRHYRVTWDANLPYGCAAHGFKSKKNPAVVVYESSALECQLFSPKPEKPSQRHKDHTEDKK